MRRAGPLYLGGIPGTRSPSLSSALMLAQFSQSHPTIPSGSKHAWGTCVCPALAWGQDKKGDFPGL